MKHLVLPLLLTLATPASAAEPLDIPGSFRSDSSGNLPPGVRASGTVIRAISWTDSKGDNLAVFSASAKSKTRGETTILSKTLFVDVFTGKNGKLKKARTVKEVLNNCEFDLTNEFLDTSVGVTDLDGDGLGELAFAYRTSCRSDVSPAQMKLLILEGPHKHILRGTTRVRPGGGETFGGDFSPDFKGAPQAFLDHAAKLWGKFVDE